LENLKIEDILTMRNRYERLCISYHDAIQVLLLYCFMLCQKLPKTASPLHNGKRSLQAPPVPLCNSGQCPSSGSKLTTNVSHHPTNNMAMYLC